MYLQINGIGTNISTQYYSHTELQLIYQEGNIRTFYFTVEKHFTFRFYSTEYQQCTYFCRKLETAFHLKMKNVTRNGDE